MLEVRMHIRYIFKMRIAKTLYISFLPAQDRGLPQLMNQV